MNFSLNEDQVALQQGIRDFCEQEFPVDKLGALEKAPVTRERWKQLAEMGVFSLRLPEAQGGVGLGMAEAVLVFAELGRRLVPGPLVWTHLAAGAIEGAASGDAIVGGLDDTHPTNRPQLVEHAGALDAFVLLRKSGLARAPASALAGRDFATPLDPLTHGGRGVRVTAQQSEQPLVVGCQLKSTRSLNLSCKRNFCRGCFEMRATTKPAA